MDTTGIERAAWGWERHERRGLDAYHAAERAALKAMEAANLGPQWEEFRRSLFGMTETRGALVSWRAEHGDIGHRAERAAFGAALGLFARDRLSPEDYVALTRPLAEALPWLLPEIPPTPSR
ncbi:MAG: hypothetical protein AUH85_02705 [Chloroflexi bacterium 13_1_40CM_4_68_4]|nr:MAG: hypothetical protein AUH85_02705 [Chloroflexi bacterium 13_1_40CM_4_68_4]